MTEKLSALILAAGKGERMRSQLPKVLHPLCGRPLLAHVLETAKSVKPAKTVVITGHGSEAVRKRFAGEKVVWALQSQQLGTAHAVLCGLKALKERKGLLYILYGDVPLLRPETLACMREVMRKEDASLVFLTAELRNPTGYGRVVREMNGAVARIVEEKDAEDWEKKITEINTGIYLVRIEDVYGPLQKVKKSIAKGEYYLTDLIEQLAADGKMVATVTTENDAEGLGVNNRAELARADGVLQNRICHRWMESGVTMLAPETIRIDPMAALEPDVILHAGVVIEGPCRIAKGAEILPYSVIEHSVIGAGAKIGPFAHVRPNSKVGVGAHVGNFVELKKTTLGPGAKANHLAYLGDTVVGARANVGAGTITCNYDGFHKYPTVIGEEAFIGSDTQLVAPVKVGRRAWVGAGTTVTEDVPAGALAVSRQKQQNIPGYDSKKRKKR
ncbi:MAG TPA: bifunctional UDP-N-acetylglucosamine diphosphorylase/glucosamine-1-phosphate N-acetyltransferase GlmU [bacterium]|nr:bifunctional UDP-N-acetylglucosamine diphosphorylase/glucosamine-1-phosphate N-acetyltransferase GlmU [bacterium]